MFRTTVVALALAIASSAVAKVTVIPEVPIPEDTEPGTCFVVPNPEKPCMVRNGKYLCWPRVVVVIDDGTHVVLSPHDLEALTRHAVAWYPEVTRPHEDCLFSEAVIEEYVLPDDFAIELPICHEQVEQWVGFQPLLVTFKKSARKFCFPGENKKGRAISLCPLYPEDLGPCDRIVVKSFPLPCEPAPTPTPTEKPRVTPTPYPTPTSPVNPPTPTGEFVKDPITIKTRRGPDLMEMHGLTPRIEDCSTKSYLLRLVDARDGSTIISQAVSGAAMDTRRDGKTCRIQNGPGIVEDFRLEARTMGGNPWTKWAVKLGSGALDAYTALPEGTQLGLCFEAEVVGEEFWFFCGDARRKADGGWFVDFPRGNFRAD